MDAAALPNWHETFGASADTSTATIYLRGDLEIFTIEYLRGEIDILRRQGLHTVTLDLTELSGLDASAATYLQSLSAELAAMGGILTSTNPQEPVSAILRQRHLLA